MSDDEAVMEGGKNAVFASNDLYYAIEEGTYPTWDFYFQIMDPEVKNNRLFIQREVDVPLAEHAPATIHI